ncbi:MAG: orotate phosphoribosyltransferase [Lautropia sp.]
MTPSTEFIRFAVETGVLRFGEFKTKAGRLSPYFFNAGLFNDGASLGRLAGFYAERILAVEAADPAARFDTLFGPAYKGIALAAATAVALAARGRNIGFAYNRKEAKDHGEGGTTVGAPIAGRVAIIDDVISAGTSVGESVAIIRARQATPAAVFIALDRMERGGDAVNVRGASAVEQVRSEIGIAVHALATLDDLLAYLDSTQSHHPEHAAHRARIADYRTRYGC